MSDILIMLSDFKASAQCSDKSYVNGGIWMLLQHPQIGSYPL